MSRRISSIPDSEFPMFGITNNEAVALFSVLQRTFNGRFYLCQVLTDLFLEGVVSRNTKNHLLRKINNALLKRGCAVLNVYVGFGSIFPGEEQWKLRIRWVKLLLNHNGYNVE